MPGVDRAIVDDLGFRLDAMIADLKELVNQESPSKSGRELSLCAATLAAPFERVTGQLSD